MAREFENHPLVRIDGALSGFDGIFKAGSTRDQFVQVANGLPAPAVACLDERLQQITGPISGVMNFIEHADSVSHGKGSYSVRPRTDKTLCAGSGPQSREPDSGIAGPTTFI